MTNRPEMPSTRNTVPTMVLTILDAATDEIPAMSSAAAIRMSSAAADELIPKTPSSIRPGTAKAPTPELTKSPTTPPTKQIAPRIRATRRFGERICCLSVGQMGLEEHRGAREGEGGGA